MAIVAAIALTTGDSEPVYKGRTLSQWISAYEQDQQTFEDAKQGAAAQALGKMTPQILPTLIRWVSYEKSPRLARVQQLMMPAAGKVGIFQGYYRLITRGERRVLIALTVFRIVGTNAAPAIPQLSKSVMDAKHPIAAANAASAIVDMGNEGIQTIVSLLHDPNNPNPAETLAALTIPAEHEFIRQEIRKHLKDSDERVRVIATNALSAL